MSIQPQTKSIEVQSFMNSYLGLLSPNNFRLKLWLRDAEALRKSNPVDSYMIEGWVSRAQGNLNDAVKKVANASKLDDSVLGNLATMYSSAGRFDEAEELCLSILQKDNYDWYAFHQMLVNTSVTLNQTRLKKAMNLFKPVDEKAQALLNIGKIYLEDIVKAHEVLEKVGITIGTYRSIMEMATVVKNNKYLGDSKLKLGMQVNEVGKILIIDETLFNVTVDDCINLNEQYFDSILSLECPFDELKKVVYNFRPGEEKEDLESEASSYKEFVEWG